MEMEGVETTLDSLSYELKIEEYDTVDEIVLPEEASGAIDLNSEEFSGGSCLWSRGNLLDLVLRCTGAEVRKTEKESGGFGFRFLLPFLEIFTSVLCQHFSLKRLKTKEKNDILLWKMTEKSP